MPDYCCHKIHIQQFSVNDSPKKLVLFRQIQIFSSIILHLITTQSCPPHVPFLT